jgi:ketosteroid isomerase-like protein
MTSTTDATVTGRSATNIGIVREVTAALKAGDLLAVMARVTRDVRWSVNAADRDAAPWFRVYEGKRDLPAFFSELAELTFDDFTLKRIVADDDVVVTWLHVAFRTPRGGTVDMDEVQIWELTADGRIASVTTLLDTAAVAAAFS